MKVRDVLKNTFLWASNDETIIGIPIFGRCSHGKVGLVLYEKDRIFRGINIDNGGAWSSKDPDHISGMEILQERKDWPK
jgi:hypothetical protein